MLENEVGNLGARLDYKGGDTDLAQVSGILTQMGSRAGTRQQELPQPSPA